MKQQQSGGSADPATMEVHPTANLFPMIEGTEFDELVADLRQNGLRTPLVLHPDGRLLDGRNRLRACLAPAWSRGSNAGTGRARRSSW